MKYIYMRIVLVFIASILLFGCDKSDEGTDVEIIHVKSVSLNKTMLSILSGEIETLAATVLPTNATNKGVIWFSGDDDIATVNSAGVVTAFKVGVTEITVVTEDGQYTATCRVVVTEPTIPVSSVTLNKSTLSLLSNQTEILSATVAPANATEKSVTWTSSDSKVATVNSAGAVTGVKAGTTTITVTTVNGAKKATCDVTVTEPIISVTGISLNKSATTIQQGQAETLKATVIPTNATNKNVMWTSTDDKVATVNSAGTVTAKLLGVVTIMATTVDGAQTAICSVTVIEPIISVTGISLNKSTTVIQLGQTETLIATVMPANATNKNVIWTSSDDKIATVSSTGEVTVKSIGATTITVTTVDGRKTASCQIKVVSGGDLDDFNHGNL